LEEFAADDEVDVPVVSVPEELVLPVATDEVESLEEAEEDDADDEDDDDDEEEADDDDDDDPVV
ncbi:hypothetical protein HK405_000031, partial [Cladochytrium tenue]